MDGQPGRFCNKRPNVWSGLVSSDHRWPGLKSAVVELSYRSPLEPIVAGGEAGLFSEDLGKMAGGGIADFESDFDDTLFCFTKQAAGKINAQIDVIVRRGDSSRAFKQAIEMKFAQSGMRGQALRLNSSETCSAIQSVICRNLKPGRDGLSLCGCVAIAA